MIVTVRPEPYADDAGVQPDHAGADDSHPAAPDARDAGQQQALAARPHLERRGARLNARLERLDGHGHPDPGEPGLADRGDDPFAARLLAAEGGPFPVAAELAQELGARQGQDVPGPAGAEGRHQLRGAHLRDAEEVLEVAAGEQVPVELFELADGVGDGEQPAGPGGHGATLAIPCWALRMGGLSGGIWLRQVSERSFRMQGRAGWGLGSA